MYLDWPVQLHDGSRKSCRAWQVAAEAVWTVAAEAMTLTVVY